MRLLLITANADKAMPYFKQETLEFWPKGLDSKEYITALNASLREVKAF
jgi:hypothetical protein